MGANLKEVRERIKSVVSTQQITKAMKMVSAAKLRRAQQAIVQLRPYSEKLNGMLTNILSNISGDDSSVFNAEREAKSIAIVIVTSNRGLAGALNSNICKAATELVKTKYAEALAANNGDRANNSQGCNSHHLPLQEQAPDQRVRLDKDRSSPRSEHHSKRRDNCERILNLHRHRLYNLSLQRFPE